MCCQRSPARLQTSCSGLSSCFSAMAVRKCRGSGAKMRRLLTSIQCKKVSNQRFKQGESYIVWLIVRPFWRCACAGCPSGSRCLSDSSASDSGWSASITFSYSVHSAVPQHHLHIPDVRFEMLCLWRAMLPGDTHP